MVYNLFPFSLDYWMLTLDVLRDVVTQKRVGHQQKYGAFYKMDLTYQYTLAHQPHSFPKLLIPKQQKLQQQLKGQPLRRAIKIKKVKILQTFLG